MPASDALRGLFSASLALKVVILVVEMKERHLGGKVSPEETSGVFSRGVFWWLNGLLKRGFGNMLDVENLYDVDIALRSEKLLGKIQTAWAESEWFVDRRSYLTECCSREER